MYGIVFVLFKDEMYGQEIELLWHFDLHCIHHHYYQWNLFRLLLLKPCHGIGARLLAHYGMLLSVIWLSVFVGDKYL